jgi:RNA polymerase sigma-70 factor, ECF subfamily
MDHPMEAEDPHTPNDFIHEITRYQSAIAAYIRSLLPTHPDYMDILQEVNVTLWKKRDKYRPGSNFKAWAFSIARYQVMNARRKMVVDSSRLIFSEELISILAEASPYENEPVVERKLAALNLCLGEISCKNRELLKVRYSDGITIEEYARQHERNPGTIRATLRRLRATLQHCVKIKMRKEPLPPDPDSVH